MKVKRETGTFVVRIIRREHSSWQGSVTWAESNKTQNFKSALELIKIIDETFEDGLEQ